MNDGFRSGSGSGGSPGFFLGNIFRSAKPHKLLAMK